MDKLTLEQKHAQFEEFFMIKHDVPVNMSLLAESYELPDVENLHQHMPYSFQIASKLSAIDTKALRPLRSLGEHAIELAEFLNQQAKKIDLMMSLVLQQQSVPEDTFHSVKFGGGGIIVISDDVWPVSSKVELKLFIPEEASAIFCFAEVITCKLEDDRYHISLIFTRIRDEDQDLLVKASLHVQASTLRKRKIKNQNEQN
jgi:hypothetical protein